MLFGASGLLSHWGAAHHWDAFYRRSATRFFKDRHWLTREWPLLLQPEVAAWTCCELGCGVGNTTYPLLDSTPVRRVFASDFSPTAVELLRGHPAYDAERIHAYCADAADTRAVTAPLPAGGCDVALLIFVLSAMDAPLQRDVARSAHAALRPGGVLLLRDYAAGDAIQRKFEQTPGARVLSDALCVRGDATLAFFFERDVLVALLAAAGFDVVELLERTGEAAEWHGAGERRFWQGVFRKR